MSALNVEGKRLFTTAFRDAVGRGVATKDAISTALRTVDANIKRDEYGKFAAVAGKYGYKPTPESGPNRYGKAKSGISVAPEKMTRTGKARGGVVARHAEKISDPHKLGLGHKITYHKTPEGLDAHLAKLHGKSGTKDAEPIEGAQHVLHSVLGLRHKISVVAVSGHASSKAPTGTTIAKVNGAGSKPPPVAPVKAPTVAAAPMPSIAMLKTPVTPKAATPARSTPVKGLAKTVMNPPGSRPVPKAVAPKVPTITKSKDSAMRVYSKDAKARFIAAFRDGVREGLPLPKLIEMGVISGTVHNEATPVSEGEEYKGPTKDEFTAALRGAMRKGISTGDAIAFALDYGVAGMKKGQHKPGAVPAGAPAVNHSAIGRNFEKTAVNLRKQGDEKGAKAHFALAAKHYALHKNTTGDADVPGIKRDEGGKFTGHAMGKGGKTLHTTSGHASHEEAAKAALAAKPNAKSVSTGHGYNGSFGITFHRPDQVRGYK